MKGRLFFSLFLVLMSASAFGDQHSEDLNYAQVVYVKASRGRDGLWRFDTTVRHLDQGWNHYADAWQVVDPADGAMLAERVLLHPHDNEQPFTRSQSNIRIPNATTHVIVRARCNVHGFGGREIVVELKPGKHDFYEVMHR